MINLDFLQEIKKGIILEKDLQNGEIEFSYTGELVPFEVVEKEFIKFVRELSKEIENVIDFEPKKEEKLE